MVVDVLDHVLSSKGGDAGFYWLVKRREVIPSYLGIMVLDQT